jgi:hypothetical protein
MFKKLRDAISPSKSRSLARAFTRLGWAGFWLQAVFGTLTVAGMVYYFAVSRPAAEARSGLPLVEYLTIVDLLLLLFTTLWSYRYTRLAWRIADPKRRPPEADVVGIVWIGVMASAIGMLFSMVVMIIEAANLLYYFLKSPQAGIPVIQTGGAESPHWVSSVDMVSLMALILTVSAELVVLVFSLWLLFRATMGSPEYPPTEAAK